MTRATKKQLGILFIECWLFTRDPKIMVYEIIPIYNWVVFHPHVYSKQPGFFQESVKPMVSTFHGSLKLLFLYTKKESCCILYLDVLGKNGSMLL